MMKDNLDISLSPPVDEMPQSGSHKLSLKERLEVLTKCLLLVYFVAVSLGCTSVFFYFLRYRFNAGGISLSDALSLILIALAYLLTLSALLIGGTLAASPLLWIYVTTSENLRERRWRSSCLTTKPIGWPNKLRWRKGFLVVPIMGSVLLLLLTSVVFFGPKQLSYAFGIVLLCGLVPGLAFVSTEPFYCILPSPKQQKSSRSLLEQWLERLPSWLKKTLVLALLTVLNTVFWFPYIQDMSMTNLGFRQENVSVRMTKEDFEMFEELAELSNMPFKSCASKNSSHFIVHGVDVIWHKLGTSTLLRFPAKPFFEADTPAQIELQPLNSNIVIARRHMPGKCFHQSDGRIDSGRVR